jgi:hypothetical protein
MLYNRHSLYKLMPDNSKPNVVVVSNTTGGAPKSDKDAILKIPKIKADAGTLLTIGGLIVAVGGGYYLVTQLPAILNMLIPPPAPAATTSGTAVPPSPVTTVPQGVYPGTGAGNFPPPLVTNPIAQIPTPPYTGIPGATPGYSSVLPGQAYTGANQQLPLQYPNIAPGGQTYPIIQSYHAVIGDEHYLDHRGRKRKFIGERHIKEIIGSEDDDKVFNLIARA